MIDENSDAIVDAAELSPAQQRWRDLVLLPVDRRLINGRWSRIPLF